MRTLEVAGTGSFGWTFRISDAGREVATLEIARLRDRGSFALAGMPYEVVRESTFRSRYRLEMRGQIVARVERQGILRAVYRVTAGDRVLTLRQVGFLGRTFTVEHNRAALGSIRRIGIIQRRAVVEMDDRVALPTQILLIFLAVVRWRSQARHHAG